MLDGNVLTQHVTTLILTAALIADVRRDTKIHDEVDLTRVLLGIQATDEEEANAIGENLGQVLQLAAQSWKGKQLLRDRLEAEVETYATANQLLPEQKSENNMISKVKRKRSSKATTNSGKHTLEVAAGKLKLLHFTFSESEDIAVLVLAILKVNSGRSGRSGNGRRETSRQADLLGNRVDRCLLVSPCQSQ